MPQYTLAFLVENGRDLRPPLEFGGVKLAPVIVSSEHAREQFQEQLGEISLQSLEVDGAISAVHVDVEAIDESAAIAVAYEQAKRSIEPYSLEEPEREAMDFSRRRPSILPNALFIDREKHPDAIEFRYYAGPGLVRLTVGTNVATARAFNDGVVRRIGELYPQSLMEAGVERSPLESRIARAMHWYSEGEGQSNQTLAYLCYFIALEGLVLKSSASSKKGYHIVERLNYLVALHNPGADWAAAIKELWDKRAAIVHEGVGAAEGALAPEIGSGHINQVKYLFVLTLLCVLEQRQRGIGLDDLWHPPSRASYTPGVTFSGGEMPVVHQSLGFSRRRERVELEPEHS